MGGWRAIVGEPDRPPARLGVSIGDTLAASYGAMGVLAALRHRDATGEGQIVDTALYEAVLQAMEGLVPTTPPPDGCASGPGACCRASRRPTSIRAATAR